MDTCPYNDLPDSAWWKRAMTDPPPHEVSPLGKTDFCIEPGDRVATAGSCFAQHMGRRLPDFGLTYYVTEPGPSRLTTQERTRRQYGLFSARFGNIYTTTQLHQLFLRAFGEFAPSDDHWLTPNGRFVDPFRPSIEPGGFSSLQELHWDRDRHFAAVREMVAEADIFIFTMGLTECWRHKLDGSIYPTCPGCGPGTFDDSVYEFVNLGVTEVSRDLEAIHALLRRHGKSTRLILTVSPVPLIATMSGQHVLSATTYSKSVLRVAAQEFTSRSKDSCYFPSYEIITGQQTRGMYFEHDLRSISRHGVDHVMRCFTRTFAPGPDREEPAAVHHHTETNDTHGKSDGIEIICDEEALAQRYGNA